MRKAEFMDEQIIRILQDGIKNKAIKTLGNSSPHKNTQEIKT